jgi:polyhydroxyalkanoate synthesis repressor PhaR
MSTVLIKRYPNRKLYDTLAKRYITLDSISDLIREGHDVEVRDHQTGEDLTGITLSQIIFEREKKDSGYLPSNLLANLIRTGGDTFDYVRRSFQASVSAIRTLESEIDQRIDSLVRRGEMAEEEAQQLRVEFKRSTGQVDSNLLDGRVEAALHRLNMPSRVDMLRLQDQIEDLTQALESLLERQQAGTPDTPEE